MLDKMKVVLIVGLVLQVLGTVFGLEVPEDFPVAVEALINSLYIVIPVALGWFKRERKELVDKLDTV